MESIYFLHRYAYTRTMQQYLSDNGNFLIVPKGEEVMAALSTFAREHGLKSAWVQGIGGAAKTTIGFRNPETKEYLWRTFEEPLEIVSLQGNLAWVDGEPFWHVHGTFAGADYVAIGGHVKELVVGLTCELFITSTPISLTRHHDEDTGLKLLGQ